MNGHITRVLVDRGFGFILPSDNSPEIFFHVRSTDPAMPFDESIVNMGVVFDVIDTPKGKQAEGVRQR